MRTTDINLEKLPFVLPFGEVYRMLNQLAYTDYFLKHISKLTNEELRDLESTIEKIQEEDGKEKFIASLSPEAQEALKEVKKNRGLHNDFILLYSAWCYLQEQKILSEMCEALDNPNEKLIEQLTSELAFAENNAKEYSLPEDKKQVSRWENNLSLADPWFKAQIEAFSKTQHGEHTDLVEFLLAAGQQFLPSSYAPAITLTATDMRFPSSQQKYESIFLFGHILTIGETRVIAVDAPKKMGNVLTQSESICLDRFIAMLSTVDAVFPLGNSTTRANYRDVIGTSFSTALSEDEDGNGKLTLTSAEKSKDIIYFSIAVADQEPLNLTDSQLDYLSDFFKSGKSYAVHCDSGVGRTGQFILLHKLWSLCSERANTDFKKCIDNILRSTQENKSITEEQLNAFYNSAFEALAELRKIRYFVETQDQFIKTLPLLLLLVNPTLRDEIRNTFDMPLPIRNFDDIKQVHTPSGSDAASETSCPSSNGLESPRPGSAGSRSSGVAYGSPILWKERNSNPLTKLEGANCTPRPDSPSQ